jgi:hypothetical protein
MHSRRNFIKILAANLSALLFGFRMEAKGQGLKAANTKKEVALYRALNDDPAGNISKIVEMMGGIQAVVGTDDIVVIKPNVQWWNQGAPNLLALKTFVDMIMDRPGGFTGEVIVAENCHRGSKPWQSEASGWKPAFERNSDLPGIRNYNELAADLKRRHTERYSTCHWIDVQAGGKRIFGPADGSGYVYCDGSAGVPKLAFSNGANGEKRRETIMTYPVFRTDRGTIVDLKNGVWAKGAYTGQSLKFVNFAALNHHSNYCGMTSIIKNYLGVSDLSGGPDPFNDGKLTDAYYNFHSFPFDKWAPGPKPGMIGAEIGAYLNAVRKADLNIVTAEWVGLASRTDLPAARTRAVLACTDPVALDFHSAKYVLYPNSGVRFHNPENPESPTHQYLKACAEHGGGFFDEGKVAVKSFDVRAGRLQSDDELVIAGDRQWGTDPKAILKFLLFRYGSAFL